MDGQPAFEGPARVGPNAVIQLAAALRDRWGAAEARRFFERHGLAALIDSPPESMIEERVPALLMTSLWCDYDPDTAAGIAADAGRRTADYIIAHRIPRIAKAAFRLAPRQAGARLLLSAIERHAWTFAGSGYCETFRQKPFLISIRDNPLAVPQCCWHVAVFERLFRRLASGEAVVRHASCCLDGKAACRFEIEP